jgi:hypothetical protein
MLMASRKTTGKPLTEGRCLDTLIRYVRPVRAANPNDPRDDGDIAVRCGIGHEVTIVPAGRYGVRVWEVMEDVR